MKFIPKLLFVLLILAITVVIIGLIMDDECKVVKKQTIKVSREIIFDQVNDFSKWENWQPWLLEDTTLKATLGEIYTGKGGTMYWTSSKFGDCDLSLTHSVYPESVALMFDFGLSSKSVALIYFEPTAEGTLVNFTLNLTRLNFWERYFVCFQQKHLKDIVSKGLERLDYISAELKYSRLGEIAIEQSLGNHAVIKVDSATVNDEQQSFKNNLNYLNRFFERRKIKPGDTIFKLVYGAVNDTLIKYAIGRVIPKRTWVWRTLEYYRFPKGQVLSVSHYGSTDTRKAHTALLDYMSEHGLTQTGIPWEVDLYNPEIDKDTSLWEIKVYYPFN